MKCHDANKTVTFNLQTRRRAKFLKCSLNFEMLRWHSPKCRKSFAKASTSTFALLCSKAWSLTHFVFASKLPTVYTHANERKPDCFLSPISCSVWIAHSFIACLLRTCCKSWVKTDIRGTANLRQGLGHVWFSGGFSYGTQVKRAWIIFIWVMSCNSYTEITEYLLE